MLYGRLKSNIGLTNVVKKQQHMRHVSSLPCDVIQITIKINKNSLSVTLVSNKIQMQGEKLCQHEPRTKMHSVIIRIF